MMNSTEEKLARNISWFLSTNSQIRKIKFKMGRFKVDPSSYSNVAFAIKLYRIQVVFKSLGIGVRGAYNSGWLAGDRLKLRSTFALSDIHDQATLVHECTHAHIDLLNIGDHSAHLDEATAYTAEAVFLQANGKGPPHNRSKLLNLAHSIAKQILKGTYSVDPIDRRELIKAISAHPRYSRIKTMPSNGVWSWRSGLI